MRGYATPKQETEKNQYVMPSAAPNDSRLLVCCRMMTHLDDGCVNAYVTVIDLSWLLDGMLDVRMIISFGEGLQERAVTVPFVREVYEVKVPGSDVW